MALHTAAHVLVIALSSSLAAQTPQPFPRDGRAAPPAPQQPAAPQPPSISTPPLTESGAPTEAQLGMPVHPQAQFITLYDAGRGQRYYLYGSTAPFAEIVLYYRTALKEKGNLVFEQPPTHMFEVGRFREETMAFPPGVTVKDYTWGGSAGYPNPRPGAQPERFPTIIQIVAAPPLTAAPARR